MLEDSVRDRDDVNTHCQSDEVIMEETPLLGHTHQRSSAGSRPRRTWCVKSKAAVAILCWNFLIAIVIGYPMQIIVLSLYNYINYHSSVMSLQEYVPLLYGLFALVYLFYPLAGCLADVKCGRYKTVVCSMWFITASGLSVTVISSSTIIVYITCVGKLDYRIFTISVVISIVAIMGYLLWLCTFQCQHHSVWD